MAQAEMNGSPGGDQPWIEDLDPETFRESFNRIVRLAVALMDGVGGEVAIRRKGHVWRSSGRTAPHAPIAPLVEASDGVLWIEDWRKDGRIDPQLIGEDVQRYPLYAGAPIRLADGRLVGVLSVVGGTPRPRDAAQAEQLMDLAGLIADDVERRRALVAKASAEAEADAARATAASLVESAPFAVSMTDRDLRILQVSRRWREERGLVGADIVGRSIYDVFPRANWADLHDRVLAGETVQREVQLTLPDGRQPWLRYEHSPWRDAGGEIVGIVSVSIEITALIEALRAAEESEKRLKLALEIGELRMWETDLRRRLVTVAGAKSLESDSELTFEDLSTDIWRMVHPADRGDAEAAWRRHLETGAPFRATLRLLRHDGPHTWVECASEGLRDETGRVERIVNVLRNIDAVKRAELNLERARNAAEAANRAKSEFLANMSHEIRTPLNGVMGVTSALGRTALTDAQREMVGLIGSSAETLEGLLSDVLDLARIESGRLELKAEPFDLAQSVRDVGALFEPAASAKGLAFEVEVPEAAKGLFLGDGPRLRQVLSNLVSNAVKFTAAGAVRVRVETRPSPDGAYLQLSVADTGIGFSAEAGERLFERFEQADGSITRRYGGSGLGLAISRSLAEAMGGSLTARSQPGQGSTFVLELALPRSADAPSAGQSAPQGLDVVDFGRMRVLLAEDHPTNRRVVELILAATAVDLTCVEDGAAAVEAWAAGGFDLVLMDTQMPVMDGLTATAEIRARERRQGLARTPIWSLTANALPEHVRASTDAGADGHLTKPISAEALLGALATAAAAAPLAEDEALTA